MNLGRMPGRCFSSKPLMLIVGIFLILVLNVSRAMAQEFDFEEFERKAPWVLLAKGDNKIPAGKLKVKTYRIEEVKLPAPIEIPSARKTLGDQTLHIESAIRITVTGGPFNLGAYTIWIDDVAYPATPTNNNTELTVTMYGPAKFAENPTISVSHGSGCRLDSDSTLPEKLKIPEPYRERHPEYLDENRIKIRSIISQTNTHVNQVLEVDIFNPSRFEIKNAAIVLQIGRHEFRGNLRRGNFWAGFRMTHEQFAQLKDGDRIIIKYGLCSIGGEYLGRLDKNLIHRQ